jgi:hypothetical protein
MAPRAQRQKDLDHAHSGGSASSSGVEPLRRVANLVHPFDGVEKKTSLPVVGRKPPARGSAELRRASGSSYSGRCSICGVEKSGLSDWIDVSGRYHTVGTMRGMCPDCLNIVKAQVGHAFISWLPSTMLIPSGPDPGHLQPTPIQERIPRQSIDTFLRSGRAATESIWPELWAGDEERAVEVLLRLRYLVRQFWVEERKHDICMSKIRELYRRFMLRERLGKRLNKLDEVRNPPTKDAQDVMNAYSAGGLDAVRDLLAERYSAVREAAYNSVALLLAEQDAALLGEGDALQDGPFESALLKLEERDRRTKGKGFRKCKYNLCPHPYFFRTLHRKDYCSDECYYSRKKHGARVTWHKHNYRSKEK